MRGLAKFSIYRKFIAMLDWAGRVDAFFSLPRLVMTILALLAVLSGALAALLTRVTENLMFVLLALPTALLIAVYLSHERTMRRLNRRGAGTALALEAEWFDAADDLTGMLRSEFDSRPVTERSADYRPMNEAATRAARLRYAPIRKRFLELQRRTERLEESKGGRSLPSWLDGDLRGKFRSAATEDEWWDVAGRVKGMTNLLSGKPDARGEWLKRHPKPEGSEPES